MNHTTYLGITSAISIGIAISIVIAVLYLTAAIVGWRGPHRKRRLARFALFLAVVPVMCVGIQQVAWHFFQRSLVNNSKLRIDPESLPPLNVQAYRDHVAFGNSSSVVHVGDIAPAFSVTDVRRREHNLANLRGKVVVVNFFATWCGPCLKELPHLQTLWDANREQRTFAMIVIGREETNESVTAFQEKHHFTFPMAADPERSIYSLFAKELVPRTFLVSSDGKICFASHGFVKQDIAELQREIGKQIRLAEQTSQNALPSPVSQ